MDEVNKIDQNKFDAFNGKGLLDIYDLKEIFDCGYSKARLVMDKLPHFRFGKKDMCYTSELIKYIDEHGGIVVKWKR